MMTRQKPGRRPGARAGGLGAQRPAPAGSRGAVTREEKRAKRGGRRGGGGRDEEDERRAEVGAGEREGG